MIIHSLNIYYMLIFIYIAEFQVNQVDGLLLLKLDDVLLKESIGITHTLQRRRLLRALEQLKKTVQNEIKVQKNNYCNYTIYIYSLTKI